MTHGQVLRNRREGMGLGLREVARQAKISATYLSHVEQGKFQMGPEALKRVFDAIQLPGEDRMRIVRDWSSKAMNELGLWARAGQCDLKLEWQGPQGEVG